MREYRIENFDTVSRAKRDKLISAIEVAKLSTYRKHSHGAIIFKGKKVFSIGVSALRNDPKILGETDGKIEGAGVHAEIAALKSLGGTAQGLDIVVARWLPTHHKHSLSRPCESCYEALLEAGIRNIYYT